MNNPLPLKQVVSVLALATLGMLCGSVFSQTQDYRRGYEQGYRDAVEASRERHEPSMPARGFIRVLDAKYGFHGQVCDAHHAVEEIVGGRRHVDVRVNNDLCGDPVSGQVKRLIVVYRCGDGPEQHVAGAEGTTLEMSCR
ncbi:MAG: hypothetical protein WCK94_03920 [Comamonadaceae bacterium]|jgi:hypothetical protein